MKSKLILGIFAVFVTFALISGPVLARPYSTIEADQDLYKRSDDVTITYDGLPQGNYQYDARIIILNDIGEIVASDSITTGIHVWVWDQYGNYGAYDGVKVDMGDYEISMSYFYTDGSVMWPWGGTIDTFEIGPAGPPITPGPPSWLPGPPPGPPGKP